MIEYLTVSRSRGRVSCSWRYVESGSQWASPRGDVETLLAGGRTAIATTSEASHLAVRTHCLPLGPRSATVKNTGATLLARVPCRRRGKMDSLPPPRASPSALEIAETCPKIPALVAGWKTCGKAGCRCGRGEPHGPYWSLRWRDGGRPPPPPRPPRRPPGRPRRGRAPPPRTGRPAGGAGRIRVHPARPEGALPRTRRPGHPPEGRPMTEPSEPKPADDTALAEVGGDLQAALARYVGSHRPGVAAPARRGREEARRRAWNRRGARRRGGAPESPGGDAGSFERLGTDGPPKQRPPDPGRLHLARRTAELRPRRGRRPRPDRPDQGGRPRRAAAGRTAAAAVEGSMPRPMERAEFLAVRGELADGLSRPTGRSGCWSTRWRRRSCCTGGGCTRRR
jgi:hypothetical protein